MHEERSIEHTNGHFERYSGERDAQEFISKALKQVASSERQRFSDLGAAETVGKELNEWWTGSIGEIDGFSKVEFSFGGEGVMVPSLKLQGHGVDKIGLSMSLDETTPLIPLEPFETREGTIYGLCTITKADEEGYRNESYFIVNQGADHAGHATLNIGLNVPVVEAYIHQRLIARASKMTEIEIPVLQKLVEREEAIKRLAQDGVREGGFVRKLHGLAEALSQEDPNQYSGLRKIEMLHFLATKSEQYIADEKCSPDTISQALLEVIGRDRTIQVSGAQVDVQASEVISELDVHTGQLADIIVHEVGNTKTRTPILVLSSNEEFVYAPMKYIQSFGF